MREALEARPVLGTESREGFVGGCTDRNVVGVPEDAVGTERDDNGGLLLLEDPRDRRDNLLEGNFGDAAVRQPQPLVAIGLPAEGAPCGFILGLANGSKCVARGGESVSNVPMLAERRMNQDEPEVWLCGVQRDAARTPVCVVVRVREDARKGPVARHRSKLSAGRRA